MDLNDEKNEMLDLVNEQNRVIGSRKRGEFHGNPSLGHRAAHIFVKNSKGEYCLQKRSLTKQVQPGKWDTSVGGHVGKGESYQRAALRELEEELGVVLADPSLLKFHHSCVWRSTVETEHLETYVLEGEGPFQFNKDEISEVRFWIVPELRSAMGMGKLTPNLEQELKHMKITAE